MFILIGSVSMFSGYNFMSVPPEPGYINFLIGFGILAYAIAIIFSVIGIFQQMALRSRQVFYQIRIKTLQKAVVMAQERLTEFLDMNSDRLTKEYPEYEKEIFKTISPTDASQLEMYLAKYPELKFSGLLVQHFNTVNELTKNIYDNKHEVNRRVEDLEELMISDWYLIKRAVPQEIKLLIIG